MRAIGLPDDVAIESPAANVPAGLTRFSGAWSGTWFGALRHMLVVERVAPDGAARVVYAWGDLPGSFPAGWQRLTGAVHGTRLVVPLGHAEAVYEWTGDGALLGIYRRHGGPPAAATLARVDPADPFRTAPAEAGGVRFRLEALRIPTALPPPAGADGPVTLETHVYRPAGPGRHPLVVFNHGSTDGLGPAPTFLFEGEARYFLARGYAVAVPMRRGRGRSGGALMEPNCCANGLPCGPQLEAGLADLDAAVAHLRAQAWAAPDRIIVAGVSRGGILAVAYAGRRPDAVQGVINFVGGWTAERCATRGFNAAVFAAAGRAARAPMLWLYAGNDPYYSAGHIEAGHRAFVAAGGRARLHLVPAAGDNGHALADHVHLWRGAADEYLADLDAAR